jgi:hypothetical protein
MGTRGCSLLSRAACRRNFLPSDVGGIGDCARRCSSLSLGFGSMQPCTGLVRLELNNWNEVLSPWRQNRSLRVLGIGGGSFAFRFGRVLQPTGAKVARLPEAHRSSA